MPRRAIYFDTETTGTRLDRDRIVEIAALDGASGESFVSFVNPESAIPPEASAIHGIRDEDVREAPTWKNVAQTFIDFCGPDAVLIAHNLDSFDKPILQNECKRAQVELPTTWGWVDSLKWSRKYRSDLPRHALQELREVFGIPANQAHRALDDVIVLRQVFTHLIDDLSIEAVLELMSAPQKLDKMPFGKYQGRPLHEVPADYVRWLFENGKMQTQLKEAFEKLGILKVKSEG